MNPRMRTLALALLAAALVVSLAPLAAQPQFEEFDRSSVEGLSKAERLAVQRAYKERVETAARAAGWVPKTDTSFKPAGRSVPAVNSRAVGTITYHSGMVGTCCNESNMVGNRFDMALSPSGSTSMDIFPVEASGSITGASFSLVSVGGTGAFFSVADQLNTGAGTAMNVTSAFFGGLATGLNTLSLSLNYVGSSFLAGVWQFGSDIPAVATGTVGGQGFHGMSINDNASTLTGFTPVASVNATVSVRGNVLTPVELQSFSIE